MIEHDTIELYRECDAGIRMGISAIDEVKDHVKDAGLKELLDGYQREYAQLQNEMRELLHDFHEEGKEPNPLAEGMARLKMNFTLAVNGSDETIAELITDGRAKDFTRRLIELQDRQLKAMEKYL